MSMWTRIIACLNVKTGKCMKKPELKKYVQEKLKNAPKITGSEMDAGIYVNVQDGYDWYMSRDCEHCKYQDELIKVKSVDEGEDYQICNYANNQNCSRKYQTCVIISIQGDLRDKTSEDTKTEFEEFKQYVNTNVGHIRDYTVDIKGD